MKIDQKILFLGKYFISKPPNLLKLLVLNANNVESIFLEIFLLKRVKVATCVADCHAT